MINTAPQMIFKNVIQATVHARRTAYMTVRIMLLVTVLSQVAFSQQYNGDNTYAPPSPNAFNLAMLSNTSVNLNTGTADIRVPIAELPGRSLKVPIELQYNSSGIKVQDVPSWVGSGWSLIAGGMITRVVKGKPDEEADGYCGTNNRGEQAYQNYTWDYVKKLDGNDWDGEPDIFYFNYLGKSGKFILDEQGIPVPLPYSNIKIQPAIGESATPDASWIITDEDGTKYIFGKTTASRETTHYFTSVVVDPDPYNLGPATLVDMTFISTWYLSEIKTPNDDETVTFNYTSTAAIDYKYYTQQHTVTVYLKTPWFDGCTNQDASTKDINLEVTIQNPLYLSSIQTAQGSAIFQTATATRQDLSGGRALEKIIIRNLNTTAVDTYWLRTSYSMANGCSDNLCKRLQLNKLDRQGSDNIVYPAYRFDYNPLKLPARNAHQVDHWGYYNSNTYGSKIPDKTLPEPCPGFYPGADRSADSLRSRAEILERITEATGGSTEFIYQAHTYSDDSTTNKVAGGARIRIVKKCDNPQNCIPTYYRYYKFHAPLVTSGIINKLPLYSFLSASAVWNPVTPTSGFTVYKDVLIRISDSRTELFNLNGYHIGYSNVVEYTPGTGRTEHYFTDYREHADIETTMNRYSGTGIGDAFTFTDFPFLPATSKVYERGMILKKFSFNQNGQRVKAEWFDYDFDITQHKREIPAVKSGLVAYTWYTGQWFQIGRYYHISKPYVLKKTVEVLPDPSDLSNSNKQLTTRTDYTYIPVDPPGQTVIAEDLYPRTIMQTLPNGEKLVAENKYISDYAIGTIMSSDVQEVKGMKKLQTKNISKVLIESITYRLTGTQKHLISGSLSMFSEFPVGGQSVYPWKQLKRKIALGTTFTSWIWSTVNEEFMGDVVIKVLAYTPNQYKASSTIASYDAYGKPTSVVGEDGITRTLEWDNTSHAVLTSETINAGTYQHKKQYEYAPLIGVTKETDENLQSKYYVYDPFNRLLMVKNTNQHIETRYHYRQTQDNAEMPSGTMNAMGCSQPGNSMSFSVTLATGLAGTTTYAWNFGNGATATTTTPYTSYTYATAGDYTATVTCTNPDYFRETVATRQVTISSPLSAVSICANGIIYYDICGINPSSSESCGPIMDVQRSAAKGTNPQAVVVNNVPGGITPPTLYAIVTGQGYSYSWSYNMNGYWQSFGSNSASVSAPPGYGGNTEGTWQVVCAVTDSCGNQVTSQTYILTAYRSTNCNQVPGIGN